MSFNIALNLSFLLQTDSPSLETQTRNQLIKVDVYPIWYEGISLQWSVPPQFGACLFNVYFCPVEDGDFKLLNQTPLDSDHFTDTTTQEYSKVVHGFYVLEVILTEKGNMTLRSDPVTWNTQQRNWVTLRSIEIQRREYWLLSRFNGIKSYLFRRKTYGKRCTRCWNPEVEKVMDSHCPVCLGTSFEGGYFPPSPLYVNYNPTPNDNEKTYYGIHEPNQIGAWTISMPQIRVDDIIVRTGDWSLYLVDSIGPTELQGNTVRQILALTQLAKGDVEYQLVKRNLPEMPQEYVF